MLLSTIQDIITEIATGNLLDKTYAGLRYRLDIAGLFPKTKILEWNGDYEFDYHCTKNDVIRIYNSLIA